MCDLNLSNSHACDNHTPKRPGNENKACDNRTPKLNMAHLDVCACDRTPFMGRPDSIFLF